MLEIEELILRVPEVGEDEARGLGREVARRVADGLPTQGKNQQLGTLDLQVKIPPGTSRSRMAMLIAEAILKGLV
jgi:hypothetical protein